MKIGLALEGAGGAQDIRFAERAANQLETYEQLEELTLVLLDKG